MRVIFNYTLTVELDCAVCRCINSGDYVESCCFACAVRSDKADDFALVDLEVQVVYGYYAAELHGRVAHAKNVLITHLRHLPLRPLPFYFYPRFCF